MTCGCARPSAKRSGVTPSANWGISRGPSAPGVYPLGPWAMPKAMRDQLIGYGPDMAKRIAHAKELLAAYEKEKGKIDWSKIKLQCATTIKFSCENAQVVQQLLKKINVNIELEPMLSRNSAPTRSPATIWLSLLGAAMDFDDPIDTFGQWFVTKGGRWYQRRSLPNRHALRAAEVHRRPRSARRSSGRWIRSP